ncbi:MAG: DUF4105 domain-containing protein [Bdellovibrionales bacterium]|nr:DUF4105 domain-containing protein [Bdellovibrionales bacterium]
MSRWKKNLKHTYLSALTFASLFAVSFAIYHVSGKRPENEMVVKSPGCACDKPQLMGDRHERALKYKFGAYAGQCIDSCRYRNSEVLSASEKKEIIWVSNVYHNDRFWSAKIPVSSVKRVEIFFENFRKSFNHVAFRFQFKKHQPVELHLQNPQAGSEEVIQMTRSLIISPEGVPPQGSSYNLKDGMLGNYALIYRLFSVEQYETFTRDLNRTLRSYKTKLNKEEMKDLLLVSLNKSSEGLNGVYQLVFNNCATATIDLVLESKKKLISESWDIWDVVDPFRGVPLNQHVGTLSSLKWWEVIDLNTSPQVFTPGTPLRSLQ